MKNMVALSAFLAIATLSGCASKSQKVVDIFSKDPSLLQTSTSIRKPTNEPAPDNSVFDQIYAYAKQNGYIGHDVLACYEDGKLKIGGVQHWGAGLTLFMDYNGNQRMDIGTLKLTNPGQGNVLIYTNGGDLTFRMTTTNYLSNMNTYDLIVESSLGKTKTMNCFLRNSGLE